MPVVRAVLLLLAATILFLIAFSITRAPKTPPQAESISSMLLKVSAAQDWL